MLESRKCLGLEGEQLKIELDTWKTSEKVYI